MKLKIVLYLFIFITKIVFSQTTLSAGDIAIIQYNSDGNPEVIKFLALTNMEVGTTLNFTDNGWITTGTPAFRTGEADTPHTWTATSQVVCGDIITVSIPNGPFNLAAGGDQILVYQGTVASPTFIFAINNEGAGVWQASATSSNTSGLPSGLTNGTNAVAVQEVDNVIYSGSLTGSKATVLANICDKSNWNSGTTATSSNTVTQTFTDTFVTTWDGFAWDGTAGDFLDVIIDGSYSTSSNGDFTACNCTINASNTLTVSSGGTVTVENDITNNGTVTVNSGGSVIQKLSSGVATGTDYTVERTTPSQSSFNVFTYWSTPILTATFAAVSPSTHEYFSFDANTQEWVLGSASTPMSPGIGYALEGPDDGTYPGSQTATFTGDAFNTGNINVGLSFSSDGDADNDWNLIGNPYPSAIDADTFLSDNAAVIGGTLYFWTHNTAEDGTVDNTEDDYAMYNSGGGTAAATGGVTPDGNIASCQGFFAQALSASNVTFTNDMRISSNTTFFKTSKKQKVAERDRIWLNMTANNSFSQILVGFFVDATDGVDQKYDGIRFSSRSKLNMYSIIDDKFYGIQGKPQLIDTEIIPLGFKTEIIGDITISIDRFEGKIKTNTVYLKDNLMGINHNLKESDYVFNNTSTGTFNNRFELIIGSEVLNLDSFSNQQTTDLVIKNKKDGYLIEASNNAIIKEVFMYNVLGKITLAEKVNKNQITVNKELLAPQSFYILKTILKNGDIKTNKIYNE